MKSIQSSKNKVQQKFCEFKIPDNPHYIIPIIATNYFRINFPNNECQIEKKTLTFSYKNNADKGKIDQFLKEELVNLKLIILPFRKSQELTETHIDDLVVEQLMIQKFSNLEHYPYTNNHFKNKLENISLDSNIVKKLKEYHDEKYKDFYKNQSEDYLPLFVYHKPQTTDEKKKQFRTLISDYLDSSHSQTVQLKSMSKEEQNFKGCVTLINSQNNINQSEILEDKSMIKAKEEQQKQQNQSIQQKFINENDLILQESQRNQQAIEKTNIIDQNEAQYNQNIQADQDLRDQDDDNPEGGFQPTVDISQKKIAQKNMIKDQYEKKTQNQQFQTFLHTNTSSDYDSKKPKPKFDLKQNEKLKNQPKKEYVSEHTQNTSTERVNEQNKNNLLQDIIPEVDEYKGKKKRAQNQNAQENNNQKQALNKNQKVEYERKFPSQQNVQQNNNKTQYKKKQEIKYERKSQNQQQQIEEQKENNPNNDQNSSNDSNQSQEQISDEVNENDKNDQPEIVFSQNESNQNNHRNRNQDQNNNQILSNLSEEQDQEQVQVGRRIYKQRNVQEEDQEQKNQKQEEENRGKRKESEVEIQEQEQYQKRKYKKRQDDDSQPQATNQRGNRQRTNNGFIKLNENNQKYENHSNNQDNFQNKNNNYNSRDQQNDGYINQQYKKESNGRGTRFSNGEEKDSSHQGVEEYQNKKNKGAGNQRTNNYQQREEQQNSNYQNRDQKNDGYKNKNNDHQENNGRGQRSDNYKGNGYNQQKSYGQRNNYNQQQQDFQEDQEEEKEVYHKRSEGRGTRQNQNYNYHEQEEDQTQNENQNENKRNAGRGTRQSQNFNNNQQEDDPTENQNQNENKRNTGRGTRASQNQNNNYQEEDQGENQNQNQNNLEEQVENNQNENDQYQRRKYKKRANNDENNNQEQQSQNLRGNRSEKLNEQNNYEKNNQESNQMRGNRNQKSSHQEDKNYNNNQESNQMRGSRNNKGNRQENLQQDQNQNYDYQEFQYQHLDQVDLDETLAGVNPMRKEIIKDKKNVNDKSDKQNNNCYQQKQRDNQRYTNNQQNYRQKNDRFNQNDNNNYNNNNNNNYTNSNSNNNYSNSNKKYRQQEDDKPEAPRKNYKKQEEVEQIEEYNIKQNQKLKIKSLMLVLKLCKQLKITILNIEGDDKNAEVSVQFNDSDSNQQKRSIDYIINNYTLFKVKQKYLGELKDFNLKQTKVYEYLVGKIELKNPLLISKDILSKQDYEQQEVLKKLMNNKLFSGDSFFISAKETSEIHQKKEQIKDFFKCKMSIFLEAQSFVYYDVSHIDVEVLFDKHIQQWNGRDKQKYFIGTENNKRYGKVNFSLHSFETIQDSTKREFKKYLERFFNAYGFIFPNIDMKNILFGLKEQYVSKSANKVKIQLFYCDQSMKPNEDINKCSDQRKYNFYKSIKENKLKKREEAEEEDNYNQNESQQVIVISIKCVQSEVENVILEIQETLENIILSSKDNIRLDIKGLTQYQQQLIHQNNKQLLIQLKLLEKIYTADIRRYIQYKKIYQLGFEIQIKSGLILTLNLGCPENEREDIYNQIFGVIEETSRRIKIKTINVPLSQVMELFSEANIQFTDKSFQSDTDQLNISDLSVGKSYPNFLIFLKKYNIGMFEIDQEKCYILGLESDCEASYYFLRSHIHPSNFYKNSCVVDFLKKDLAYGKLNFLIAKKFILPKFNNNDLPIQYRDYEIKIYEENPSIGFYSSQDKCNKFEKKFYELLNQQIKKIEQHNWEFLLEKQSYYERLKTKQIQEDLFQRFGTVYKLPQKFTQSDKSNNKVTFKFLDADKNVRCRDYLKRFLSTI